MSCGLHFKVYSWMNGVTSLIAFESYYGQIDGYRCWSCNSRYSSSMLQCTVLLVNVLYKFLMVYFYLQRGRRLLLALTFYTFIVCCICYITISPTSTQLVLKKVAPTVEHHRTKSRDDDEYIFSQARPAPANEPNISTNNTRQATVMTGMERPSVRHFYRSMKDFQVKVMFFISVITIFVLIRCQGAYQSH